jgi:hypothetical protein
MTCGWEPGRLCTFKLPEKPSVSIHRSRVAFIRCHSSAPSPLDSIMVLPTDQHSPHMADEQVFKDPMYLSQLSA